MNELNETYNLDGFDEYMPPAPKKKRGRPKKFIEGKELVDKLKADLGMNDKPKAEPIKAEKHEAKPDMINNPPHYTIGGIETWDFIISFELDFCLGSAVKYISRAGHKDSYIDDIKKAKTFIEKEISICSTNDEFEPHCRLGMNPLDFIIAKKLSYPLGRAIEYIVGFPTVQSLEKAAKMLDYVIEQETKNDKQ